MAEDPQSVSERQLAEDLEAELFSGAPRSVSEAVAEIEDEAPPITVTDEPVQPEVETPPPPVEPPQVAAEPEVEEEDVDEEEDDVVWAVKRFGSEDLAAIARGAREQDRHISRLTNEKKGMEHHLSQRAQEAEQLAVHWYEAAQQAEQQAAASSQMGMPLSSAEEQWVENVALTNPVEAARQAALNGNVSLYNAVLGRVAEENPGFAANIGAQVQLEMQQYAMQEEQQYTPQPLEEGLSESIQRLGIDLEKDGEAMRAKVGELGEYHPYVQAILNGEPEQRDLALRAVSDLVKTGTLTRRRVRDESREATIRREGELRREAAGVVTGAPHTPPPTEDPLLAAMTDEWKARRQWGEE